MSRRIKLSYLVRVERWAPILDHPGDDNLQRAVDEVLRGSGLLNGGARGVQPRSIRFEIEGD